MSQVIVTLEETLAQLPVEEEDRRRTVATTLTYLQDNQSRMAYTRYGQEGLPVSSAVIESLIKEVNYRVKGTGKF